MKKLKICIVVFMTMLLFGTLTVSASAITKIATSDADVYVGEMVNIPVNISGNTGFVSASIIVEFDDTVLTLTEVNDKSLIDGAAHTTRFTSPYILSWENDIRTSDYIVNGTLAELVFEVSPFAEQGDYDIKVSVPTHGILDANGDEVECTFSLGTITILSEECSHEWGDWKKSSNTRHKRSCELCGEVEYDSHEWDDGEVTEEATEESTGLLTYTCGICSATKTEVIPEIPAEEVSVTGVTLDKSSATLNLNDTLVLKVTINPSNATNRTITWTSSNSSVAKVSGGTVTALSAGTTTITATSADGGYMAQCVVTVKETEVPPSTNAYIKVESVTATPGSSVRVPITLSNNPGFVSMTLKVTYDTSVLTLIGVEDTGLITGAMHTTKYSSPYTLTWENDTVRENITATGTIVYLVFQVSDNADTGAYSIGVTSPMDGIYNYDEDNIEFQMISGDVSVRDYIFGDVNGDGVVTNKDRLVLARYLAEWEGYDISMIDQSAADVNCDGAVTNKDRLILARHLAEWDGYETLPKI